MAHGAELSAKTLETNKSTAVWILLGMTALVFPSITFATPTIESTNQHYYCTPTPTPPANTTSSISAVRTVFNQFALK